MIEPVEFFTAHSFLVYILKHPVCIANMRSRMVYFTLQRFLIEIFARSIASVKLLYDMTTAIMMLTLTAIYWHCVS